MIPSLVSARRLTATLALAAAGLGMQGCRLDGDTSLPPFTNPTAVNFAPATGVTLSNMTRINEAVYIQDVVVGTGRTVAAGDSVVTYYTGWLSTGFVFDSRLAPATPASFRLDTSVIPGWVDALPGMKVGGKRKLVIGPAKAYRYDTARDAANNIIIPANSVLVFDVEVVQAIPRP